MTRRLKEEFVSDDQISNVPDPQPGEGGEFIDPQTAITGVQRPEEDEDDDKDLKESFASLFDGLTLTEGFQEKASLIFESAVHAASERKLQEATREFDRKVSRLQEDLAEKLEEEASRIEEEFRESAEASVAEIVEGLDKYLDYVISEWAEENRVALESGIKVHMAESLMTGLKGLFEAHNIDVSEETVSVVSKLEEDVSIYKEKNNGILAENIELKRKVKMLEALQAFDELSEGLTLTQKEKFKQLVENVDVDSIESFKKDARIIRESFFKQTAKPREAEAVETFVEDVKQEPAKPKMIAEDVNTIARLIGRK